MTQPPQQVQVVFCNACGLARAAIQAAPSKLTIVGAVQQIAPCPFCVFREDVVANLERAEGVIRELQGMAEPVVVEADPSLNPIAQHARPGDMDGWHINTLKSSREAGA